MNGPGAVTRERGTSEELAGPRCLADLEIPPSQPPRPIWVPAYLEPEFRRVVGEGLEMPRDQFIVARRRLVAPLTGLRHTANLTQDAGELSRVIGIVGGDRQWAQPGNRGVGLAQGSLDFGQMTLRGSIAWQAAMRGAEPCMGVMEIALLEPHLGAPEVEQRQRKRRDTTVASPTLVKEALRCGHIPALGMKSGQRPEGSEIGSTFRSLSEEWEGLVVASDRLEDCGVFGAYNRRISSEPLRPLKVGQGVREAMECGPRPSAGEEGHAVSRGIAS